MPPPVDNHVVQGQQQDLQYDVMGYYNIANDHPPPHGHRDDAINDYAAFALDVPSHAQAAPPAPVCTDLSFPHTYMHLTRPFYRRRLTFLTAQLGTLRLVLLKTLSMYGLPRAVSPTGRPMKSFGSSHSSTCESPIHKFL
jgi:hypothetical protein